MGTAASADYSGVPTSVTFQSGDIEKTFTFTATQNSVDDDSESVKLGFGTLTHNSPTQRSAGMTHLKDQQIKERWQGT